MDGFKKIELDQEPKKPHRFLSRKKISIAFIFVILFLFISIFFIVLPAKQIYSQALIACNQAQKVWDAVKKQNIEEATIEVEKTKKELKETQDSLKTLSFVRFIPVLNNYYNDAEHLAQAGVHGLDAASGLLSALMPYTDLLGLKGKGSFVMGTAEQRINTAVLTMGKITPSIDGISKSLILARGEIDKVDANHYPEFLGSLAAVFIFVFPGLCLFQVSVVKFFKCRSHDRNHNWKFKLIKLIFFSRMYLYTKP
jgi:hypothetical protein